MSELIITEKTLLNETSHGEEPNVCPSTGVRNTGANLKHKAKEMSEDYLYNVGREGEDGVRRGRFIHRGHALERLVTRKWTRNLINFSRLRKANTDAPANVRSTRLAS